MKRALAGAGVALALGASHPGLPIHRSGSVVGEGLPLKAYANITPTVHLFGDTINARLAVVADTRWVDPMRLRVTVHFAPYEAIAAPTVLRLHTGRFEQVTWTWKLRCLRVSCVPVIPPSETFHVFRFPAAQVLYLLPTGKTAFGLSAVWPPVKVLSQVSPAVANALLITRKYDWQYALAPVAAPTFRVSPTLLFWLALGAAGLVLVGAFLAGGRWLATVRPRRGPLLRAGTPLEQALALLAWAHAHGDETLQRKAFERVAGELGVAGDLSRAAHELAWSARLPEDEEIQAFTEQARRAEEGEE